MWTRRENMNLIMVRSLLDSNIYLHQEDAGGTYERLTKTFISYMSLDLLIDKLQPAADSEVLREIYQVFTTL